MNQHIRNNTSHREIFRRQDVPTRLARIALTITLACSAGACAPAASTGGTGGAVGSGGSSKGSGGTSTGSGGGSGGDSTGSGSGGAQGPGSGGSQPESTGGSQGTGTGGLDTPGSGGATATGGRSAGTGGGAAGGISGGGGTKPPGSGGTTGAGGGSSDDMAAAQVLNGYTILKPCVSSFKPTPNVNGDCCCEELAANENQHIMKAFGGDPNVTYNVKVRIAGIAERYWYTGGTLDPVGMLFYTGGLPTIHSTKAPNNNLSPGKGACKIHPPETDSNMALPFKVPVEVNPADGCFNGFNIFAMTVSAPKQSYFLNYTTDFDGADRQPHKVYKNDYTVTIPIKGGASLDFYTIDGDHHEVTNDGTMTVPNLKTAQPYNGNFLEFTVLDVTRGN